MTTKIQILKNLRCRLVYPPKLDVAHIGWDGPSVNAPIWMSEYRSSPEFSSATLDMHSLTKSACQDTMISVTQETSLLKDYKRLLRENAMKFLMDDMYTNPGPLQFDGPGSVAKFVTLCVGGQDYIGRIKKLQEYLEKMHITSERLHKQSVVIKQICKLFPQCQATFPGLWLSDITLDSYNVPEVHESRKEVC